jgi:hypothetical protein
MVCFHVSVPDIEVYSDYPDDTIYDQKGTTIMSDRYIRHEYGSGSDPSLLVGTWDLTEIRGGDDPGVVASGTAILIITNTTYSITSPYCKETGTYTADSKILIATIETVQDLTGSVDCGFVGEIYVVQYSVNSTTLNVTNDDETTIWNRL